MNKRFTRLFMANLQREFGPFVRLEDAPFYKPVLIENPADREIAGYLAGTEITYDPQPTLIEVFRIPPADYQRHWDLEGPHA